MTIESEHVGMDLGLPSLLRLFRMATLPIGGFRRPDDATCQEPGM